MQVFSYGQQVISMDGVGDIRERALGRYRFSFDIVARYSHGPAGGAQNPGDAPQGARFTGAIGADQSQNFPRLDLKTQVGHGLNFTVTLAEVLDLNYRRVIRRHKKKTSAR